MDTALFSICVFLANSLFGEPFGGIGALRLVMDTNIYLLQHDAN